MKKTNWIFILVISSLILSSCSSRPKTFDEMGEKIVDAIASKNVEKLLKLTSTKDEFEKWHNSAAKYYKSNPSRENDMMLSFLTQEGYVEKEYSRYALLEDDFKDIIINLRKRNVDINNLKFKEFIFVNTEDYSFHGITTKEFKLSFTDEVEDFDVKIFIQIVNENIYLLALNPRLF